VLRGARSPSLGYLLAEKNGITPLDLEPELRRGYLNGKYLIEDTRADEYALQNKRKSSGGTKRGSLQSSTARSNSVKTGVPRSASSTVINSTKVQSKATSNASRVAKQKTNP
jgi:hypothetical protein